MQQRTVVLDGVFVTHYLKADTFLSFFMSNNGKSPSNYSGIWYIFYLYGIVVYFFSWQLEIDSKNLKCDLTEK